MPKLVKLTLAGWRRQRLRTALTVGSLTLAVGAVVFVYSLSVAFQSSGSASIERVIGGADIWVVPSNGVSVDRDRGTVVADGELPANLIRRIEALPGVESVETVSGSGAGTLRIRAADAEAVGEELADIGLTVSSNPARGRADAGDVALAYMITASADRFAVYSFAQQFESVQVNEVAASVLGVVGRVTLGLGFLSVLTSLLISIDERRREFGILAAVGITDDVLYLFLTEAAMLIAVGLVSGVVFGALLFAVLLPSLFAVTTVLEAVALVSVYFPIMMIAGALIPAWRLLQKSPLELLRTAP